WCCWNSIASGRKRSAELRGTGGALGVANGVATLCGPVKRPISFGDTLKSPAAHGEVVSSALRSFRPPATAAVPSWAAVAPCKLLTAASFECERTGPSAKAKVPAFTLTRGLRPSFSVSEAKGMWTVTTQLAQRCRQPCLVETRLIVRSHSTCFGPEEACYYRWLL